MLGNIKSTYILQFVFSIIFERKKLELIKYYKNLQNKLDINLINYKFLSGKYIIYEKNGKAKEYDSNDDLIFEGKYINGKRNGKGKEYDSDGKLIFEGEYINGKKMEKEKDFIMMVN